MTEQQYMVPAHIGTRYRYIVVFGAANQAGEDNRNVARMALLLAGLPKESGGVTVNRLCASGLQAIMDASRAVMLDEADMYIAGGVESMSRAPFVTSKAEVGFSRNQQMFDTTIGWRFINPALSKPYRTAFFKNAINHALNITPYFFIEFVDQQIILSGLFGIVFKMYGFSKLNGPFRWHGN